MLLLAWFLQGTPYYSHLNIAFDYQFTTYIRSVLQNTKHSYHHERFTGKFYAPKPFFGSQIWNTEVKFERTFSGKYSIVQLTISDICPRSYFWHLLIGVLMVQWRNSYRHSKCGWKLPHTIPRCAEST